MRKKKPTLAGLKRQVAALEEALIDAKSDALTIIGESDKMTKLAGDLQTENGKLDKQVNWYERQREEQLRYFDEALLLFKPHLVPNPATNAIDQPENSLDRFLLQMRERLSRYYSADGRYLYTSPDWRDQCR